MKRALFVLAVFFLLVSVQSGLSEQKDYASMSYHELEIERERLLTELESVNMVIGGIEKQRDPENALGRISDLFPDEKFALLVRDQCAKFSIDQPVTQADLDRVTDIDSAHLKAGETISDLEGIGYLTNLRYLSLGKCYTGNTFPEEMRVLKKLKLIDLDFSQSFATIPDWIGDLEALETLSLWYCTLVVSVPNSIGNCSNMKHLNISNTGITSLPDSIYNLNLETLDMSGTGIR